MTAFYAYWISTGLLCLLYIISAALYVMKRGLVRQTFVELGYPGYLHSLLIVVKILAVLAILFRVSVFLSDLAYAGMFYHLLLSALAHIGSRNSSGAIPALTGLVLMMVSFSMQNVAREIPSPYAYSDVIHAPAQGH
ncbi:DoxX family protein [Pantoea sp. NGS-ED-1003]|uniref:DoxX family protein n=1 Tax=Pantoea sp. NGS-ED-1003 TaxID=1526743 RepID=UPI00053497B2|nr:DoxX family protein [Pantoea sp. NGS-ED-1003]